MTPLEPTDPRTLGRYRLLGRLGGGGMGRVFLGRSPGGRPVAVKIIHPAVAAQPGFRGRFAREVEAARRVGGFHTAQVVDASPDSDPPWLVTAYVPGPTLREAVLAHGALPVDTVLALGSGLAEGLAAVHGSGLVHRDLKPGNVILAADGPRIIDFGIAHLVDASTVTATGAFVGTPAYMAPEQADGEGRAGPASDVFALGAVLAFAATGTGPFEAGSPAVAVYRVLHESPDLSAVPAPLRELVAACLAKDPAGRPGVDEILERLQPRGFVTGDWLPPAVTDMVAAHPSAADIATSADAAPPADPVPPADAAPPVPSVHVAETSPRSAGSARRRVPLRVAGAAVVPVVAVAAVGVWFAGSGDADGSGSGTEGGRPPASIGGATAGALPAPSKDGPSPTGSKSPGDKKGPEGSTPSRSSAPSKTARPRTREQCRPEGHAPVPRGYVKVNPCVRVSDGRLSMVVRVGTTRPQGTADGVYVWTWIADRAGTKYAASLRKCPVSLAAAGDVAVCGPYAFVPPGPGSFSAGADATVGNAERPPAWAPRYTGVTSGLLEWRP